MANQMLGKMHVVLENVIQTKYECQSEGKVKKRKYENEIFPDRDPHVEIQSEMDIASC